MNTSNIDEIDLIITTRVYKDLPGLNGVEINMRAKLTEEAKARVQQELLKARIETLKEVISVDKWYYNEDALFVADVNNRIANLQAKLKGDDK